MTHTQGTSPAGDTIGRLEAVLRSRRAGRPVGSYTATLFADPSACSAR